MGNIFTSYSYYVVAAGKIKVQNKAQHQKYQEDRINIEGY